MQFGIALEGIMNPFKYGQVVSAEDFCPLSLT